MAKGRLSKQEMYCIEQMSKDGKSVSEIAEFLGRSESVIASKIEPEGKPSTTTQKEKKKNSTLFIRRTAGKKDKAVSIMTPAESERSDDTKTNQSKIINRYKSAIHMISDEEGEDG